MCLTRRTTTSPPNSLQPVNSARPDQTPCPFEYHQTRPLVPLYIIDPIPCVHQTRPRQEEPAPFPDSTPRRQQEPHIPIKSLLEDPACLHWSLPDGRPSSTTRSPAYHEVFPVSSPASPDRIQKPVKDPRPPETTTKSHPYIMLWFLIAEEHSFQKFWILKTPLWAGFGELMS